MALGIGPVGPVRETGRDLGVGLGVALSSDRTSPDRLSVLPWNVLALVLYNGCEPAVSTCGWQLAINSELARTGGIRLSN